MAQKLELMTLLCQKELSLPKRKFLIASITGRGKSEENLQAQLQTQQQLSSNSRKEII